MLGITIYAPIVKEIAEWAADQADNLSTTEIRINFATSNIELYNYESGVVESTRPLPYFTDL